MQTTAFPPGGYQYVKGVFQYSAAVCTLPGYRMVRVRFDKPVELGDGFARIERIITATDRPLTAFCACELRSPAPFTEEGFRAFNEIYVGTLARWGIFDGTNNPVARSNVCPEIGPPPRPSFHAFTYTEPSTSPQPCFVVSGSAEATEGPGNYRDRTIRLNDVSADGLREKARWVLGEMERRLAAMNRNWEHTTATQVYTVHDIFPLFADEIVRRGAARSGLIWHFSRPPVVDLEYEMDCRAIMDERVMSATSI